MRRSRAEARGDAGVTLVELMVAMTVMTVVMTLFTGGMIQLFQVANRNDANTELQSQLHRVFIRLDKEVRYASAISEPGTYNGAEYVEYFLNNGARSTCVELRLTSAQRLERRTWEYGKTTVDLPGWVPLAYNVTATSSTAKPFVRKSAAGATDSPSGNVSYSVQRLSIELNITAGGTKYRGSQRSQYTFTALNSTMKAPSDYCREGRPYT